MPFYCSMNNINFKKYIKKTHKQDILRMIVSNNKTAKSIHKYTLIHKKSIFRHFREYYL